MRQDDSITGVRVVSAREKQSWEYVLKSGLAGGLAGATAKTAVAPLDRVKILFQSRNPQYVHHVGSVRGVFGALAQILQDSGVKGLFQGHSAMLTRIFPYAAVQFMSYEQYKGLLIPTPEKRSSLRSLCAGALAGATSVLATYPLDLIRAQMAYQIRQSGARYGFFDTCSRIARGANYDQRVSVGAFYRGIGPSLVGVLPYGGVSFMSYELLKSLLTAPGPLYEERRKNLQGWKKLACGALAGTIAQTASYPLDVVRRRMQLQTQMNTSAMYSTSLQAVKHILRNEGWRGFYLGLSINFIKVIWREELNGTNK